MLYGVLLCFHRAVPLSGGLDRRRLSFCRVWFTKRTVVQIRPGTIGSQLHRCRFQSSAPFPQNFSQTDPWSVLRRREGRGPHSKVCPHGPPNAVSNCCIVQCLCLSVVLVLHFFDADSEFEFDFVLMTSAYSQYLHDSCKQHLALLLAMRWVVSHFLVCEWSVQ